MPHAVDLIKVVAPEEGNGSSAAETFLVLSFDGADVVVWGYTPGTGETALLCEVTLPWSPALSSATPPSDEYATLRSRMGVMHTDPSGTATGPVVVWTETAQSKIALLDVGAGSFVQVNWFLAAPFDNPQIISVCPNVGDGWIYVGYYDSPQAGLRRFRGDGSADSIISSTNIGSLVSTGRAAFFLDGYHITGSGSLGGAVTRSPFAGGGFSTASGLSGGASGLNFQWLELISSAEPEPLAAGAQGYTFLADGLAGSSVRASYYDTTPPAPDNHVYGAETGHLPYLVGASFTERGVSLNSDRTKVVVHPWDELGDANRVDADESGPTPDVTTIPTHALGHDPHIVLAWA